MLARLLFLPGRLEKTGLERKRRPASCVNEDDNEEERSNVSIVYAFVVDVQLGRSGYAI